MTETNSFILTMDGKVTESFKTTVLSSPYLATATTSKACMALTIGSIQRGRGRRTRQLRESFYARLHHGQSERGKAQQEGTIQDLFTEQEAQTPDGNSFTPTEPLEFSQEAQAVLDAGRELWRYYHKQAGANPNASYYDIKMHFQGTKTTKSGKVQINSTSEDATYNALLADLRQSMKLLAAHIEPKVYEYGFLKK